MQEHAARLVVNLATLVGVLAAAGIALFAAAVVESYLLYTWRWPHEPPDPERIKTAGWVTYVLVLLTLISAVW